MWQKSSLHAHGSQFTLDELVTEYPWCASVQGKVRLDRSRTVVCGRDGVRGKGRFPFLTLKTLSVSPSACLPILLSAMDTVNNGSETCPLLL